MLSAVTTAVSTVIDWVKVVIVALTTAGGSSTAAGGLYELLPLFAVGIAISVIMVAMKIIRKIIWAA